MKTLLTFQALAERLSEAVGEDITPGQLMDFQNSRGQYDNLKTIAIGKTGVTFSGYSDGVGEDGFQVAFELQQPRDEILRSVRHYDERSILPDAPSRAEIVEWCLEGLLLLHDNPGVRDGIFERNGKSGRYIGNYEP